MYINSNTLIPKIMIFYNIQLQTHVIYSKYCYKYYRLMFIIYYYTSHNYYYNIMIIYSRSIIKKIHFDNLIIDVYNSSFDII